MEIIEGSWNQEGDDRKGDSKGGESSRKDIETE